MKLACGRAKPFDRKARREVPAFLRLPLDTDVSFNRRNVSALSLGILPNAAANAEISVGSPMAVPVHELQPRQRSPLGYHFLA